MVEVDPLEYFEEFSFRESPVLRLAYYQDRHALELVVDYWAQIVSDWFEAEKRGVTRKEFYLARPYRMDFRRLVFLGISDLRCDGSPWRGSQAEWEDATAFLQSPQHSIIWVELTRQSGGFVVGIEIQHLDLEFAFERLMVDRRLARCRPEEVLEPRAYFDVETGEEINYYDPFPERVQLWTLERGGRSY